MLRGRIVNFLPATAHRTQPWKNGLGVSQLIAEVPPGVGFDAVLWQISVTEIGNDCPFSSLPGLDRQFVVIEGAGVELANVDEATGAASARMVQRFRPYAFPGDWRTSCRLLDGPVRVLNVMTRRGQFAATVEIRPAGGKLTLNGASGETLVAVDLQSLDAWLLDGGVCTVAPSAGVALVRVAPTFTAPRVGA
jgi:environmental stress-induced protein Ves